MLPAKSNNQEQTEKQFNGLITCARYAFMPNKLQYCGGDNNKELFEYSASKIIDPGLTHLLQEFQTLYPYLKLIAETNKIKDIFDYRVVEAYWIGNELLDNVDMNKLYWHFIDGLNLKKKLTLSEFEKIVGKIPKGALPHHSFHVLNVYFRTGHLAVEHTLESMDHCRIGWGKIMKVNEHDVEIETQKLTYSTCLSLSETINKKVLYKFLNRGFIDNPQVGQIVSYHWNWACEIITDNQQKNLEKYTRLCIALANNH